MIIFLRKRFTHSATRLKYYSYLHYTDENDRKAVRMKIQKSSPFFSPIAATLVALTVAVTSFTPAARAEDPAAAPAPTAPEMPVDAANPYGAPAADTAPVAPADPNAPGMGSIGEEPQLTPIEQDPPVKKRVKKKAKKKVAKNKSKKGKKKKGGKAAKNAKKKKKKRHAA
jgi:hypothetical protein